MGIVLVKAATSNHGLLSPHPATISPGTASCARTASLARSRRFGSLTCCISRKIGAFFTAIDPPDQLLPLEPCPRPVFDFDTAAWPRVFSRTVSATRRLGPRQR